MAETPLEELVGKTCGKDGRFLIVRMLGRGGMGAVFEARDTQTEKRYAIKFLLESRIDSPEFARRFRHEGVRWRAIKHPHVVRVHGLGRSLGMPFILSEFVEGRDLEQVIQDEELTVSEVLRIGREIADALAEIHDNEIVHRDLKPTNVMLRDEDRAAKLLDFGMAKYMNSDSLLTRPGDILGTPGFIPPEQLRGGDVDYRGDIFSLGAMLYEILSGQPAFQGAEMKDVLKATSEGKYVSLKKLRGEIPKSLVKLVEKMIQRNPRKRPPDMRAVITAIEGIEREISPSA